MVRYPRQATTLAAQQQQSNPAASPAHPGAPQQQAGYGAYGQAPGTQQGGYGQQQGSAVAGGAGGYRAGAGVALCNRPRGSFPAASRPLAKTLHLCVERP